MTDGVPRTTYCRTGETPLSQVVYACALRGETGLEALGCTVMKLVPIILCGGAGTRLWPVSRESMPKPFMRLTNGGSLLQATAARAVGLDNIVQLAVVTNVAYSYKVVEDLAAAKLPYPLALLLEPE